MISRRIIVTLAITAGLAAVVAIVLLLPRWRSQPARLLSDDPRVLTLGAKVYGARCAVCHGAKLQGQEGWRQKGADGLLPAPPHDASGHTWHHPDDVLFRITKFGVAKVANMKDYASAMPPFEGALTDAEIVAVLSWIRSQWPEDIRARQDEVNQNFQQARQR